MIKKLLATGQTVCPLDFGGHPLFGGGGSV